MSAHLRKLIRHAYDIIGDRTPLEADCGKLCDAACCKGDDHGMLLFPGEAVMLSQVNGFRVSKIKYMDGRAWLLLCDGGCDRDLRPLSCRIFPLVPRVDGNGTVSAVPDPRGRRMCPLADGRYLSGRFIRAVETAFRFLSQDGKMLGFMRMLSQETEELERLLY